MRCEVAVRVSSSQTAQPMFLWSYRGVVYVLLLFALYSYLIVTGHDRAAEPWINGALLALIAFLFVRIWLK
jgi:hypothetical protein